MRLGSAALGLAIVGAFSFRDLDVVVPPGTPLEWRSTLPERYVRPEPPFALTRVDKEQRYAPQRPRLSSRLQGVIEPSEILTIDFASHLALGDVTKRAPGLDVTGAGANGAWPPPADRNLYWQTTASLLQLMLHPRRVSRLETLARLIQIGEAGVLAIKGMGMEGSLRDEARELDRAIGSMPDHTAAPIVGKTPFETMMQKFVADELCAARPYDANCEFGKRLLLLGDEIVPFVVPYLSCDHSFARRNAAALLGMIDTPQSTNALAEALVSSADRVLRMRAIQSFGRRGGANAAKALTEALAQHRDPIEIVAIVHALGEAGDPSAIPTLLAADVEGTIEQGDLDLARLAALVRLDAGASHDHVQAYVQRMLHTVGDGSGFWQVQQAPQFTPDTQDPPNLRGETAAELAHLLLARLNPDNAALAAAAVGCFDNPPLPAFRGAKSANRSFGGLAPAATKAFLAALGKIGEPGLKRLRAIAVDSSVDPELRFLALTGLPVVDACDLAADLALGDFYDLGLRLAALEFLDRIGHPRVLEVARELADRDGLVVKDWEEAKQHWRVMLLVQALGSRGKLTTKELADSLLANDPRGKAPPQPLDRALDEAIVAASAVGGTPNLDNVAAELLYKVFGGGVVAAIKRDQLDEFVHYVAFTLAALTRKPGDASVRDATRRALDTYLAHAMEKIRPAAAVGRTHGIPMIETILFELARRADDAAVDVLAGVVRDRAHPARAAACIALGASDRRDTGMNLVYALRDGDRFVRLCAYLSLRHLTGQDFFADWLESPNDDQKKAADEYGQWLARHS